MAGDDFLSSFKADCMINRKLLMDVMYLDGKPVIHIIDKNIGTEH